MVHYYLSLATANIEEMSQQNSNPLPGSTPEISPGFSAQSQMGLPEVLQMCCQSRRSGQITFRSGESYGFIFIQHGKVLHAMCGTIEGEEAVYTMLTWPGGGFTLNEDILPHKKTITLTWEQLLFEGARRADEGMILMGTTSDVPVTTAEPASSNRAQENQPKLVITRPDLPPSSLELVNEYTHVGRTPGNEIALPYPSVSSRHCIFILSGVDVVLRDLNSSNGTLVNGTAINETVLRPGDVIQVGTVQIKFEAGIKRPKLNTQVALPKKSTEPVPVATDIRALAHDTLKLPTHRTRDPQAGNVVKTDSAFVKGEAPISYNNLAKPAEPPSNKPSGLTIMVIVIVVLAILGGGGYYIFFVH